jgi:predicted enzyme related to lactoylglutathione lyase
MSKGHIYFEIQADDPARAISFYSQVFGWKFDEVKGLPVPYWRIETGSSRGGLLKRPAITPPAACGANAFVCSLEVEDFDETAKIIGQLGGVVALPKFAIPKIAGRATSSMLRGMHSEFSKWMRTPSSCLFLLPREAMGHVTDPCGLLLGILSVMAICRQSCRPFDCSRERAA